MKGIKILIWLVLIQEVDPEKEWKPGDPFTREIPYGLEENIPTDDPGGHQTFRKFGGRAPRMTSRSINYEDQFLSEDEFEGKGPMKR